MNGWTALVGIEEVERANAGGPAMVSAAAGAAGMLAAQIAREIGVHVIGIAGGTHKCVFLKGQLGLTAAVDHRAEGVGSATAQGDCCTCEGIAPNPTRPK
jgi:NADPH-dependent curcumin reductase CurA